MTAFRCCHTLLPGYPHTYPPIQPQKRTPPNTKYLSTEKTYSSCHTLFPGHPPGQSSIKNKYKKSLFTHPTHLPLTPTFVYHAFLLRIITHHHGPEGWGGREDDDVKFGESRGFSAVRLSTTCCRGDDLACLSCSTRPADRDSVSNVTAEARSNLNGSVLTWRASVSEQREEDYDANEGCRCVCLSPRDIHRHLNRLESVGLPYSHTSVKCSHQPRANSLSKLVSTFHWYLAGRWDGELTR